MRPKRHKDTKIYDPDTIDTLVEQARKDVNYIVNEYTVEVLSGKFSEDNPQEGDIYVPEYQRQLVWSVKQKSYFIESLLIKIPIPPVFLYDVSGRLEIVDGSQRLRTIHEFFKDKFKLTGLEKLTFLNGIVFSKLPPVTQRRFKNTSIRSFFLLEGADHTTRFDLFRRLNTSGRQLTPSELRRGLFPGPFIELVRRMAKDPRLVQLAPIAGTGDKESEREELVVRFFAYSSQYQDFTHDVEPFLNKYVESCVDLNEKDLAKKESEFDRMIDFVLSNMPYGFRRAPNVNITPRVRFEAIAVGTHLALEQGVGPTSSFDWLDSPEFRSLVRTDASNSGPKLRGRIEFVRDRLLHV